MIKTFNLAGKVDERLLLRSLAQHNGCTMRHRTDTGITTVDGEQWRVDIVSTQFYRIIAHMYFNMALTQAYMLVKHKMPMERVRSPFVSQFVNELRNILGDVEGGKHEGELYTLAIRSAIDIAEELGFA